jgi:hypothetical protein
MKPRIGIVFALVVGAALGVLGAYIVAAQQPAEQRTVLLTSDLVGSEGYEVRMSRTDIGPEVVGQCTTTREPSALTSWRGSLSLGNAGRRVRARGRRCAPCPT